MFFGFELEGLHEGVDIRKLYVGVGRMIQAFIMGATDDWAGEERRYLKSVEVERSGKEGVRCEAWIKTLRRLCHQSSFDSEHFR